MILEILQAICLGVLFFFNGDIRPIECKCESRPVLTTQPVIKPPVFTPRKPPKP